MPVIEDVPATHRWRRRIISGWAGAVTAVTGAAAGLSALAWHVPGLQSPIAWAAVGVTGGATATAAGWLWRRQRAAPAALQWRPHLVVPHGAGPGWRLTRPSWRSSGNRLSAGLFAFGMAVPLSVAAGDGAAMATSAGVVVGASAVAVTRRLARLIQLPQGVALLPDGVVTNRGLLPWDDIGKVEVRTRVTLPGVRLSVRGRRPLMLDGGDFAMPASELVALIERYRDDPRQRPALAHPVSMPDGAG